MLKWILTVIATLGIPGAFWNFYLREAPDLQYSLSAGIPLVFQDTKPDVKNTLLSKELVQQIEVANSGNGEAKKIVVKIQKSVTQYQISKHSATDQTEIAMIPGGFELVYPSLPPASRFQLTIKTIGTSVDESNLTVSHQAGRAKVVSPGAQSNERSILSLAVSIAFVALYSFLMYISLRDQAKYYFLFRRYWHDLQSNLSNGRPWYIRENDWPDVLSDLITRALSEPIRSYKSISECPAYVLLASDKPPAMSQADWDRHRGTAFEKLLEEARVRAKQSYAATEVLDILDSHWPDSLSEANKQKLMESLSTIYLERVLNSLNPDKLEALLDQNQKHPKLTNDAWESFKKKASFVIAQNISAELFNGNDIDLATKSRALNLISYSERKAIENLRQGKIAAESANRKQEEAKELERTANQRLRETASEGAENERERKQLKAQREKVHRQLDIIERVMNDTNFLDRIEPDDDTFAPGNWLLLRQLVGRSK